MSDTASELSFSFRLFKTVLSGLCHLWILAVLGFCVWSLTFLVHEINWWFFAFCAGTVFLVYALFQNLLLRLRTVLVSFFIVLLLISCDVYLEYQKGLPERLIYNRRAAARHHVFYDTRSKLQVVQDLRAKGDMAWLSLRPQMFIKTPLIAKNGQTLLPLGGISNVTTVVDNESGRYLIYRADEHGFNNLPGLYNGARPQIAIIGDSFAQGFCVPPEKNAAAYLKRVFPRTINLGMGGSGPLTYLALFREFAEPLKPRVVLWFHCETNDFFNLEMDEHPYKILQRYLDPAYSQHLMHRQAEIDGLLKKFSEKEMEETQSHDNSTPAAPRITLKIIKNSLNLENLRTLLHAVTHRPRVPTILDEGFFEILLQLVNDKVRSWGGTLYVVYLPEWNRYHDTSFHDGLGMKAIPYRQYDDVMSWVKKLNIPAIDIQKVFQETGDPLSFFVYRGPNHFNEEGYALVGKAIAERLKADGVLETSPLPETQRDHP